MKKVCFSHIPANLFQNFFLLSVQLKHVVCYKSVCPFTSYTKFLSNFFYNSKSLTLDVSSFIYQKLHLYGLQSSNQKQQLSFFYKDFCLFQFFELISQTSSLEILEKNTKKNRNSIQHSPEQILNAKNLCFSRNTKIIKDSFFVEILLLNNNWFEPYETNSLKILKTFTGENWLKNHLILKKKLFLNFTTPINTSRINNVLVSVSLFLKKQLAFEAPLCCSFIHQRLQKSVIDVLFFFLFEYQKKFYKLENYSYFRKISKLEKVFIESYILNIFFQFKVVPVFMSIMLTQRFTVLDFLPKKEMFLNFFKESKLQFYCIKQFLKKYVCFYFNQTVSLNFKYIRLNYNSTKFVPQSYCEPFNIIDKRLFKCLKKYPLNSLTIFTLQKRLRNDFFFNETKQQVKIFSSQASLCFLTIFKLKTLHQNFHLKKFTNYKHFQTNWFKPCLLNLLLHNKQSVFALQIFFYNIVKKLMFYGLFLNCITNSFNSSCDKKKIKVLKNFKLLKSNDCAYINQEKLLQTLLYKQFSATFNTVLFFEKTNPVGVFSPKLFDNRNSRKFLFVLNAWTQENNYQFKLVILNKQKKGDFSTKQKKNYKLDLINLLNYSINQKRFQQVNFSYNEYSINLLNTGFYFILPSELNVFQYVNFLKKLIKLSATQTQEVLMITLNPKIYAWCYFYRFIAQKQIFYSLDQLFLKWLWRWACRRHKNKSKKWIKTKYFYKLNQNNWVFATIVLKNSVQNSSEFTLGKQATISLFIYFPFQLQILWNLKKTFNK